MTPEEKDKRFHELFEAMVNSMTDPDHFSRPELIAVITELCEMFQLSKAETEFYQSEAKEKRREGEYICDFDNGRGGSKILSYRFVTRTGAVVKSAHYRPDDEPPLSDTDLKRLDLCMRTVLSFVSRNRLTRAVEALGFYDERGFRNMRSYMRCIERLYWQKKLPGAYTAMLCNLQHFTLINEDVGRKNGDVIMQIFYNRLSEIIGEDGILARMGGDKFLGVFRNEQTAQITEFLRGVPVVYDSAGDKRVLISASAGMYLIPPDFVFNSPSDIMDKIMPASQVARNSEMDTIVFYNVQLFERKQKARRIQQLFPIALRDREFRVYYQPKVDVETGELVGAEALCRWFRGDTMIPPSEFIPFLEQTQDICELDFYMLHSVCADIRRWLDENRKPVRVSVNLSRKHLSDMDLLEHIMKTIDAHQIPHQYIEIELTETTTDVEFRDLKRVVTGLQQCGVFTSVDDFGMGYSSLNLIREIPWNVLKIDRCFLPADNDSDTSVTSMMYRHVVAMALDLGLECITEGVETTKQIEILRRNHCRIAQGFYFDKPMPVEQFEKLLADCRYPIGQDEI